jgi:branched-chain amino acid transport system substrate-binding protein
MLLALIKKNDYKKIAILHDKGDHGQSIAEAARDILLGDPGSGRQVVAFEGVTSGQISFDAVISKIKDTEAEVLLWGGYYNDAAKLVTQMRQKKVKTVLIGSDGLYDRRFLNIAQGAAEGTYCVGRIDFTQNAAAKEAVADHRRRYYSKDIGAYFFYAIGATQSLFSALEKAGLETDLTAIKKRLNEDTVETVMGPVRYDAKGDVIGASFKLFVAREGRFVEINL